MGKIHGYGSQNLKGAMPFPRILVIKLPTQKGIIQSNFTSSNVNAVNNVTISVRPEAALSRRTPREPVPSVPPVG
jgi:hypothetical protein